MTEIEFKEWIKNAWAESGGLITQKTASMITGLSESQISRRIDKGEIKIWEYRGMKGVFVSFPEAMNLKRERKKKTVRKKKDERK